MNEVRTYCEDERGCVRCTAFHAEEAASHLWRAFELGVDTPEGLEALKRGIRHAEEVGQRVEGIYLQD